MAQDEVSLRVQIEELAKPGFQQPPTPNAPPSSPAPQPPPVPSPVTAGNQFSGIPQPAPFYFAAEEAPANLQREPIYPPGYSVPSSPERREPGRDPVEAYAEEFRAELDRVTASLEAMRNTVEETGRALDDIPLPFTEDMDEGHFREYGIDLSREATRDDLARMPPIMPPGWRPPVDAEAVGDREQYQRWRDYHTPPPSPSPVQAPPINPLQSRRAFGLATREALAGAGERLGAQLPGIVGGSVGAAVGAATGSPTLGGLAGTAVGSLASILPPQVSIPLAGVASVALAVTESFKALRSIVNQTAQSLVGINGQVTAASARAELRDLENKLYTGREVGGILAQNIDVESQLDRAVNKIRVEIIREFGPGLNKLIELVANGADTLAEAEKNTGLVAKFASQIFGPLGPAIVDGLKLLGLLADDKKKDDDNLTQAMLDFLDPTKVNEIPFDRKPKQGKQRKVGGIF